MDELISVIVPVYKVERYLERCVKSLLNQTYRNMEIILVDDGSPDNCPQMCDDYAKRYDNVRVLHKENGGLSSARNAGINVAQGKYIGFVDSDDWVVPDMYEYLMNLLHTYNADVAQISYVMAFSESDIANDMPEKIELFKGKDILQYYMTTTTTTGSYSVCRCLFSKKLIDGIYFRDGKVNEDIDFKYKVLRNSNKFAVSNQQKYFYFQDGESTTRGGLKRRDFDLYEAAEELFMLTKDEAYGTISKLGKVKKARTAFSLLSRIAYYGIADDSLCKKELVKMLKKEHRGNLSLLLGSPIPISRKILSIMFAISYSLTETCIHFARRFS
jgi:glycosyltransferase involved in cell wall biosynthesis